ncbi:MAG TPA: ATP-binding protein [Pyrinomonadaceae bacterium]|nr:ATP-binding protein [Pyrinomonadaceae bacterium]
MSTPRKLLLLFLAISVVPVVTLGFINYRSGVSAVETQLRGEVEREAQVITREFESRLREREDALSALARSPALRDYVRGGAKQESESAGGDDRRPLTNAPQVSRLSPESSGQAAAEPGIPPDVQGEVRALIRGGGKDYVGVTCLGTTKEPLFRAEISKGAGEAQVSFETRGYLPESLRADERVWSIGAQAPLRSGVKRESFGSVLRYTIPVFPAEENSSAARGALVIDLMIDALLDDAAGNVAALSQTRISESSPPPRLVVVLDRAGNALYHSNEVLRYQSLASALPASFKPLAAEMNEGRSGWRFYEAADGDNWIGAYQPLAPLDLSVAVAGDYSAAVRSLRNVGWLSVGLIALVGVGTAILLLVFLRRNARSIERVTEGAVAIAGGNLNQRIEVRSSDEIRLLAESFNAMSDRLREQIAREAESRQFQSFMRLSAMLTHDLKNSILSLSLLVGNMEQQFDREEFRADAMKSLTQATDKLRTIVAKLSEPVRSLSGEFKRPRPVDLIPVIKRALERTAEPAGMHEIEIELPSTLVAVADDERIERVVENLVINALEAMGAQKGKLTVKAGEAEENFVFFSVSDTGPGMTEEFQRTRLFRPFATTKAKGVGLGLYTCRELVRALGGRVEVESEYGSGTTFRIVLPSIEITEASEKSGRAR